ncbi:MAG: sugar ABC transporter substrate-binding protein [Thermomicrobiales bacterium]
MSTEYLRTPSLARIAAAALAVCLIQPLALSASTPTAVERESDALIRSLDPSDLPGEWKLPAHTGHVVDYQVSEWNQYVIQGESNRAADYGITFSVVDAGLDAEASIAGIDELLENNIEVLNFTAVDQAASAGRITDVRDGGIPVICATSHVDGCATVVSADDYGAAYAVGVWAGNYVRDNFNGTANVLDIGYPTLDSTQTRSVGFHDGIVSVLGNDAVVTTSVDGNGLSDVSVTVAAEALLANPDINVIFGINDDSAIGGLQAYEAAGLNLDTLLVVGFGCAGNDCKDLLMENGPFKVSAATFPEYQGRLLIDVGVAAFNGMALPSHFLAPSVPLSSGNVEKYYALEDETWVADLGAISAIPITTAQGNGAE